MARAHTPRVGRYGHPRPVPHFREEARTFFRLSPNGSYGIRRGELEGRIDVPYYLPEFRENARRLLENHPGIMRLEQYAEVVCGPFGSAIKLEDYVPSGVPLLRISNISDDGRIDESNLVFLDAVKASELKRTQVEPGDLVVSQRGTLGAPAVVPATYSRWCISANLIAIKRPTLQPHFVQAFMSARPGALQLRRAQSGQVQGKITTADVAHLFIPRLKSEGRLLAALDSARVARRKQLAEADALLSGLDGFVLDTLGLTLPAADAYGTTYAVRASDVRWAKKLYPDYFHPERISAIRAVESQYAGEHAATLLAVADFVRDQRIVGPTDDYLGLANVQPNTGERIESEEEDGKGNCFLYARGDVLFARLRPYLNKVCLAESAGTCSTEFHVIRVRRNKTGRPLLIPDYLAAVMRSSLVLAQTRHMMTGNTHPRLANEDVVNLVVPVPDAKIQEKIAAEVLRGRQEARALREGARAIWDHAKRRFEEELLGPEGDTEAKKTDGAKRGRTR